METGKEKVDGCKVEKKFLELAPMTPPLALLLSVFVNDLQAHQIIRRYKAR